jgi:hypothetical protein
MLGFTTSTAPPALELPQLPSDAGTYATQALRVAALKAQDEALWKMPDQTKVMDWLNKYKVWIIVGSAGLLGLALFGRRRR